MSEIVMRVQGLAKRYEIGATRRRYGTLRDHAREAMKAVFWREARRPQYFWALDDVSFDVHSGEVVGIIGRNGAGKSTLLKILARITEPTRGRAEICGRVGSLLEVGTGFDRELTGRENVYLSGAVMGMRKAAIERKFDEILEFSGIERFIDTPVKRYSSGMYVRLAFAVAAHLEPEILIVDEVLAVGDVAFQQKCLDRMSDATRQGRTVLFVSHNMGAVETLCTRGIVIDAGRVAFDGVARQAVGQYLARNRGAQDNPFDDCARSGNGRVRVVGLHFENGAGERVTSVRSGERLIAVLDFETDGTRVSVVSPGIGVMTEGESPLFLQYSHLSGTYFDLSHKSGQFRCAIEQVPLAPGRYLVGTRILAAGEEADWAEAVVPLFVEAGDYYGTGSVETQLSSWGPFLVRASWSWE
jgi:lipopolysaccharide transport system ATP-binding protein